MITQEMIADEVRGDASLRPELEADLHAWRDGLITLMQDIEAQFALRRGERAAFQAECFATGDKRAWFAFDAEYEEWRGAANFMKRKVTERMREVKRLIAAQPPRVSQSAAGRFAFIDAVREVVESVKRGDDPQRGMGEVIELMDAWDAGTLDEYLATS